MKISEALFKIARKDLEAAKCLYEKEFYPQAVFYLQQSVEKANKSWAIVIGIIKEGEAKKALHNPLKIYIKSIKKQREELEKVIAIIKKVPEVKETKLMKDFDVGNYYKGVVNLLDVFEFLEEEAAYKKLIEEILFIQEGEIRSIISKLNNLELQKVHPKDIKISEKDFIEKKESYIELYDVLHRFNPPKFEKSKNDVGILTLNLVEQSREEVIREIQSILNGMYVSYSLYCLSFIMLPHATVTRYPDNNHDPLKIYNKNQPLIQLFDDLVEIMEKTLSKMENILFEI